MPAPSSTNRKSRKPLLLLIILLLAGGGYYYWQHSTSQKQADKPAAGQRAAGAAPASGEEQAISLVQAMYANRIVDGYEMRQRSLRPVYVGDLKVQMIAEYRGSEMTGRVLRIENKGAQEATLTEASVAPASSLAVSIAEPRLAPGKVTTAYLVSRTGN